jgi:hypothetical protein
VIKCKECIYFVKATERTEEEERQEKLHRLREKSIDISEPLDVRPGTCHYSPPHVELTITPAGVTSLTLWPSVPPDGEGCGAGQPEPEARA